MSPENVSGLLVEPQILFKDSSLVSSNSSYQALYEVTNSHLKHDEAWLLTNVAFLQQKSRVRCVVRRGRAAGQFAAKLFYLVRLVLLLSDLSYFKVLERRQKLLWRLEIEGFCKV